MPEPRGRLVDLAEEDTVTIEMTEITEKEWHPDIRHWNEYPPSAPAAF